jgi:hypothetical protein
MMRTIEQAAEVLYDIVDIKNRFVGEDICFGAHTPMGIIQEIVSFDNENMEAKIIVEYPDGETKSGTIEIDDDLGGFDARE